MKNIQIFLFLLFSSNLYSQKLHLKFDPILKLENSQQSSKEAYVEIKYFDCISNENKYKFTRIENLNTVNLDLQFERETEVEITIIGIEKEFREPIHLFLLPTTDLTLKLNLYNDNFSRSLVRKNEVVYSGNKIQNPIYTDIFGFSGNDAILNLYWSHYHLNELKKNEQQQNSIPSFQFSAESKQTLKTQIINHYNSYFQNELKKIKSLYGINSIQFQNLIHDVIQNKVGSKIVSELKKINEIDPISNADLSEIIGFFDKPTTKYLNLTSLNAYGKIISGLLNANFDSNAQASYTKKKIYEWEAIWLPDFKPSPIWEDDYKEIMKSKTYTYTKAAEKLDSLKKLKNEKSATIEKDFNSYMSKYYDIINNKNNYYYDKIINLKLKDNLLFYVNFHYLITDYDNGLYEMYDEKHSDLNYFSTKQAFDNYLKQNSKNIYLTEIRKKEKWYSLQNKYYEKYPSMYKNTNYDNFIPLIQTNEQFNKFIQNYGDSTIVIFLGYSYFQTNEVEFKIELIQTLKEKFKNSKLKFCYCASTGNTDGTLNSGVGLKYLTYFDERGELNNLFRIPKPLRNELFSTKDQFDSFIIIHKKERMKIKDMGKPIAEIINEVINK